MMAYSDDDEEGMVDDDLFINLFMDLSHFFFSRSGAITLT
jgi:hypothetical protein